MEKAQQLVDAMRILHSRGLINVRGGNGSVKVSSREFLMTPSGLPKHLLKPDDLVLVRLDGTWTGKHKPTIEYRLHLEIYRRVDSAQAILHSHNPYTILALRIGLKLDPRELVETRYAVGECIAVVEELEPGSIDLARRVGEESERCRVIVLENHGVVAYGETIYHALDAIEALEDYARIKIIEYLASMKTNKIVQVP